MILVAGGTGTLGRQTVARLTAAGEEVRVLTRHAAHVVSPDVEVALGDVRDPATVVDAVEGVSSIVSAVHGFTGGRGAGPQEVDRRGNGTLLRAAVDAGVEHFVLVSVLDARADHPMSLHRAKYAAEQDLRGRALSWTVLRPAPYVETWVDVVGGKLASGGPALVFGRALNPINFVSVHDVAALVQRALTDPELHARTIDVPGSVNLTLEQLARELGASEVRHVPRGALRLLSTVLQPLAPALARQTRAALVMDTTDMTADATALHARFPHIDWRPATEVAAEHRAARSSARSS